MTFLCWNQGWWCWEEGDSDASYRSSSEPMFASSCVNHQTCSALLLRKPACRVLVSCLMASCVGGSRKAIAQHCRACLMGALHWDDFICVWTGIYYSGKMGTLSLWFSLSGFFFQLTYQNDWRKQLWGTSKIRRVCQQLHGDFTFMPYVSHVKSLRWLWAHLGFLRFPLSLRNIRWRYNWPNKHWEVSIPVAASSFKYIFSKWNSRRKGFRKWFALPPSPKPRSALIKNVLKTRLGRSSQEPHFRRAITGLMITYHFQSGHWDLGRYLKCVEIQF